MPTSTSTRTSSSGQPQPPADQPAPAKRAGILTRAFLIALMAIGSVGMWLVVPIGLVYVVSQSQESTQPSLGPYMIILFGVPIGMTIIGKGLGALDRYYGRRTGSAEERRRAAWLQSMRGERKNSGDGGRWKVLDAVMIWSVCVAGAAMGIWFFFFAGSSI